MAESPPILTLSDDELRLILDQIQADPERAVKVDRRAYLSVESFAPPPRPSRDEARDVATWRRVCKRFAEIGIQQQFANVTTRLSYDGLGRLRTLADELPHVARHVKKFSYMVPYFYQGHERILELPAELRYIEGSFNLQHFNRKISDQRQIIREKEDLKVLKRAFSSFSSLRHVQLLRVEDREDGAILTYTRRHTNETPLVELQWPPACEHSTRTIGAALLHSDVPWCHFSSPMLSPISAMGLAAQRPSSFSALAERLTCLELHFDDGNDLDTRIGDLSELFRVVFTAATNMKAVHVGFPSHRPISLPLESLFHNVRWEKLLAFGVQGWKLDETEIINLALRHQQRLKGLRLRDVYLKDGSMWKNVLGALRDSMERLDWVSLRRIGYVRQFDELWANAGAEVPDDPAGGDSDSEGDDTDDMWGAPGPSNTTDDEHIEPEDHEDADEEDREHTDDEDHDFHGDRPSFSDPGSDDELGPAAHAMDFPPLNSPSTPASAPWCNCNGQGTDSLEELGDDGYFVSNMQRRAWEKWVVRRCPEHSTR